MRSSILVICYCPEAVTRRYSGKKKKKKKDFKQINKAGGLSSAILLKKRL